ncbi:MAG: hypothetical protein ABFS19_05435 [Thermodesulfobacteriota bacterium]
MLRTTRRLFYGVIGFSYPFFYVFHSVGWLGHLYEPFTDSEPVGFWPPFISSLLVYLLAIVFFELCCKALKIRPGGDDQF